jgi:hypothetical protein
MLEIAVSAHNEMREEAGGWRFGDNHALIVHSDGRFYDFSAGKGGRGALALIAHLNGGGSDAALAWLSQHAGDGRLGRAHGDEAEDPSADDVERAAYVQGLSDRAQPLGPQALQSLASRGLDPAEAPLRWLPAWRGDEGALLAAIIDDGGQLVALQITHITPGGEKSAISPVRLTLRGPHDWRTRGVFRLGSRRGAGTRPDRGRRGRDRGDDGRR